MSNTVLTICIEIMRILRIHALHRETQSISSHKFFMSIVDLVLYSAYSLIGECQYEIYIICLWFKNLRAIFTMSGEFGCQTLDTPLIQLDEIWVRITHAMMIISTYCM